MELWGTGGDRHAALAEFEAKMNEPPWPDRDSWGEGYEARRAQERMEALAASFG